MFDRHRLVISCILPFLEPTYNRFITAQVNTVTEKGEIVMPDSDCKDVRIVGAEDSSEAAQSDTEKSQ